MSRKSKVDGSKIAALMRAETPNAADLARSDFGRMFAASHRNELLEILLDDDRELEFVCERIAQDVLRNATKGAHVDTNEVLRMALRQMSLPGIELPPYIAVPTQDGNCINRDTSEATPDEIEAAGRLRIAHGQAEQREGVRMIEVAERMRELGIATMRDAVDVLA
jgi:hypothetical protein